MEIARHWRLRKQRYSLSPENGGAAPYPVVSPNGKAYATNGNGQHAVVTLQAEHTAEVGLLTRQGTVYSYTVVTSAPADFEEQAPYVLALIQLDDGSMLTAQLTDMAEEPEIGMRVEMVTRKLRTDGDAGIILYGYKFRPLLVQ